MHALSSCIINGQLGIENSGVALELWKLCSGFISLMQPSLLLKASFWSLAHFRYPVVLFNNSVYLNIRLMQKKRVETEVQDTQANRNPLAQNIISDVFYGLQSRASSMYLSMQDTIHFYLWSESDMCESGTRGSAHMDWMTEETNSKPISARACHECQRHDIATDYIHTLAGHLLYWSIIYPILSWPTAFGKLKFNKRLKLLKCQTLWTERKRKEWRRAVNVFLPLLCS